MRAAVTIVLRVVFLVSIALLLVRSVAGPVHGLITARSTLNVVAVAFLTFIAILARTAPRSDSPAPAPFAYLALAVAAFLAFLPTLNAPFVFDDYVHLTWANSHPPLGATLHRIFLEHPTGGDGFFRPVGLLFYWSAARWAHWNPVAWHLIGLVLHVANTLLVCLLLRRELGSPLTAFLGALLFAWHGAHVEAVSWTAASFDLLATLFCLVALVSRRGALVVAAALLAFLSKEAAYCLPFLIACLAWQRKGPDRARALGNAFAAAIACAAVFAYRMWYLRGIGGYKNAAGSPMVLDLHPLYFTQALFLRLPESLVLPVNWSVDLELWLRIALVGFLVAWAAAAFKLRRSIRPLYVPLLFTLAAAVPVFPLLLIDYSLWGARILYLPSVGFALLAASLLKPRWFVLLLTFQLAALVHNELNWKRETILARQACTDTALFLKDHPSATIDMTNLPRTRHGVFFLSYGFPQCVANAGAQGIFTTGPADYALVWNESARRLETHPFVTGAHPN